MKSCFCSRLTEYASTLVFCSNDYLTYVPKYDARTATAEENKVHSQAKELFYKS